MRRHRAERRGEARALSRRARGARAGRFVSPRGNAELPSVRDSDPGVDEHSGRAGPFRPGRGRACVCVGVACRWLSEESCLLSLESTRLSQSVRVNTSALDESKPQLPSAHVDVLAGLSTRYSSLLLSCFLVRDYSLCRHELGHWILLDLRSWHRLWPILRGPAGPPEQQQPNLAVNCLVMNVCCLKSMKPAACEFPQTWVKACTGELENSLRKQSEKVQN